MTKKQFIKQLRAKLKGLPKKDIEERIAFYLEIIDDKMEEGATEEDAIQQIGSVEDIAGQILEEPPLAKRVKKKGTENRKLGTWEIVLLILGFPLWFPLLVSAFAVALSLYVVVFSLVIVFWAVFVCFVAVAFAGLLSGLVFICTSYVSSGVFVIAGTLVCAGLGIFSFYGCKYATQGVVMLTKTMVIGLKKRLTYKENA